MISSNTGVVISPSELTADSWLRAGSSNWVASSRLGDSSTGSISIEGTSWTSFPSNRLSDVTSSKGFVASTSEIWYSVGEGSTKSPSFSASIDFVSTRGSPSSNGGEDSTVDSCDSGVTCSTGWESANKSPRSIRGVNSSALSSASIVISSSCISAVSCTIPGTLSNSRWPLPTTASSSTSSAAFGLSSITSEGTFSVEISWSCSPVGARGSNDETSTEVFPWSSCCKFSLPFTGPPIKSPVQLESFAWSVEGRSPRDSELSVSSMAICSGGITLLCWVSFPSKSSLGAVVFPGNASSPDSGCFRSASLLLALVICCWSSFILSKESVVAMSAIAEVSLKRLNILFPFTERSGDEVRLLDPKIPLSKRLFSWWKVLLVKLTGLEAKFCDTDDSIFRMASVMSFLSLSTTDNFFDFSLRFGVDWDAKGWIKLPCEE